MLETEMLSSGSVDFDGVFLVADGVRVACEDSRSDAQEFVSQIASRGPFSQGDSLVAETMPPIAFGVKRYHACFGRICRETAIERMSV